MSTMFVKKVRELCLQVCIFSHVCAVHTLLLDQFIHLHHSFLNFTWRSEYKSEISANQEQNYLETLNLWCYFPYLHFATVCGIKLPIKERFLKELIVFLSLGFPTSYLYFQPIYDENIKCVSKEKCNGKVLSSRAKKVCVFWFQKTLYFPYF